MDFFNFQATDIWFKDGQIWVKLKNGDIASDQLSKYPLLANATVEQLQKVEIIDGYALYWPELDEDLSVAGFFNRSDTNSKTTTEEALQKS